METREHPRIPGRKALGVHDQKQSKKCKRSKVAGKTERFIVGNHTNNPESPTRGESG